MADGRSPLEAAQLAVQLARRAGAEQADAFAASFIESEVTVRLGVVDRLLEAGSRSLGLRVIVAGRTAICSTADLSDAGLGRLATETVDLARISAADEHAGLPDAGSLYRQGMDALQLFDERVAALTTDEKIRMALAGEGAALAADKRISNSDGARLETVVGEVALANSLGFAGAYPLTSVSLMVEVMADDAGGKKRNAYWYSSERSLHRMQDPEEIGRIAARRAVDQLGARKMPTRKVAVVFEPLTAVSLLGNLAAAVSGAALYRRATFLAGRVGDRIGSDLVNVVDDGTLAGRAGSRPFDGEGVATCRNPLFQAGIFHGFLFDSYSARRSAAATTGSASRGVASLPAPGPSNMVWAAGERTPGDLLAGIEEGLYVTSLMGSGFNPTTGDYSRGAGGFWIERGQLAYPVSEVNISGQFAQMLADVDAVADDLTWFGGMAAPTIRVREMTVSGE